MSSWGSYQLTTVTSDGSSNSSAPASTGYFGGAGGPSLPHLVTFTLATIGVAFTLGGLRMLLLYCRHRRSERLRREGILRPVSTRLHTTWQQQHQQQQHAAEGAGKEKPVQVMVMQPGDDFAIGTQLSNDKQTAADFRDVSDREVAAKAVDEASSRDAARQTSSP